MHSESTMLEFLSRVLLTLGSFYIFFFFEGWFLFYLLSWDASRYIFSFRKSTHFILLVFIVIVVLGFCPVIVLLPLMLFVILKYTVSCSQCVDDCVGVGTLRETGSQVGFVYTWLDIWIM